MNTYFPLHVHSHYSMLDAASKPKDIAKRCLSIGVPGSAITDHGNIAGCIRHYTTMKKNGLRPLLGCEFYVATNKKERSNEHLLIIAKNLDGWKSLITIISEANRPENFYYKPRLTLEELQKYAGDNLIGIAGHLGSVLSGEACSVERLKTLRSIFGKENFFMEVQLIDRDFNSSTQANADAIRALSQLSGTKCVATPDAHYPNSEDAVDQRILLCNRLGTTLTKIDKKLVNNEDVGLATFFKCNKYHIPSYEEMAELHTEDELKNTLLVADMCEDFQVTHNPILPQYETPGGIPSDEYLRQLCRDGWMKKLLILENNMKEFGYTSEQYGKRFEHELEVLQEAKLSDYFLIVKDIIEHAKNINCLVGAGRGSAAGSLILYLLDVTKVDPIAYDLLFQRFYNRGRNVYPQISFEEFSYAKFINSKLPSV
jgi:DNA polymerase III subunit alpha